MPARDAATRAPNAAERQQDEDSQDAGQGQVGRVRMINEVVGTNASSGCFQNLQLAGSLAVTQEAVEHARAKIGWGGRISQDLK